MVPAGRLGRCSSRTLGAVHQARGTPRPGHAASPRRSRTLSRPGVSTVHVANAPMLRPVGCLPRATRLRWGSRASRKGGRKRPRCGPSIERGALPTSCMRLRLVDLSFALGRFDKHRSTGFVYRLSLGPPDRARTASGTSVGSPQQSRRCPSPVLSPSCGARHRMVLAVARFAIVPIMRRRRPAAACVVDEAPIPVTLGRKPE